MESPPHKKPRLIPQPDPSGALQESPLHTTSNDVLDHIFRRISEGEKRKMGMEIVCKKFQSRIISRSSWFGEYYLELGSDQGNVLINGYGFSLGKASLALSKLLDIITVKKIVFKEMSNIPLDILVSLCHSIAVHRDFVNLTRIRFNNSCDYDPVTVSLVCCGLDGVTEVECGDWDNDVYVDSLFHSFYSMLAYCPNLEVLSLVVNNISQSWTSLLPALTQCKNIRQIYLASLKMDFTHQNALEFAQVCSSIFTKLDTLHFFIPHIMMFEPSEFFQALNEGLRSNIKCLCFALNGGINSHQQCLMTLPNSFPNLRTLSIPSIGSFSNETVLQAIENIFSTHAETDSYKLELIVRAENRGELLMELAQENDNAQFVEITARNGIWKCVKGNVLITLDLMPEPDDHLDNPANLHPL